MKSSAKKVKLASVDDLFSTEESRQDAGREKVVEIALSELHPFPNHPFQVRDDDSMKEAVESVKEYGILTPAIVRPRDEGGYEIVAGHRRKYACELAGLETMPAIIRDIDRDMATIIMVDSNLQREKILPSEKAFAYKMKLEALKHQGQRRDLTLERGVPKLPARERIALEAGESCGLAITRYIALTKLIPPLLVLVDEDKLSFSTAADYISALTAQEQTNLVSVMDKLNLIPSKGQLVKIKQHSKDGTLTPTVIEALLKAEHPAAVQVVLKQTRLRQYFPQTYTAQQMEEVIVSLLETWKIQHL